MKKRYYAIKVFSNDLAEVISVEGNNVSSLLKSRDMFVCLFPEDMRSNFMALASNYGLYDEADDLVSSNEKET